jgi:hypothetical protein
MKTITDKLELIALAIAALYESATGDEWLRPGESAHDENLGLTFGNHQGHSLVFLHRGTRRKSPPEAPPVSTP